MSKQKYSANFKIHLMRLYYESHWSFTDLWRKYHVGMLSLQDWNNLVKFWGYSALRAHSQRRFSIKFRLKVVKYYLHHHEGCSKVAERFEITHTHVQKWTNKYIHRGVKGLTPRYELRKKVYDINKRDKLARCEAENVKLRTQNKGLKLDKLILKTLARVKHQTMKRHEQ